MKCIDRLVVNRWVIPIAFIFLPFVASATGQAGDQLIYQGDTLSLHTNPLEQYFQGKASRSINGEVLSWTSTGCYRGYFATWELVKDSLFLVSIQKGCQLQDPEYYDLQAEFGKTRVFAQWYTGTLLVPQGNLIHYVHSGYESFYESELEFTVARGQVTGQQVYDNSRSYQSVFTTNQDSLATYLHTHTRWTQIPDLGSRTYTVYLGLQSGPYRSPDSVFLVRSTEIEAINQEALRLIESLPGWDVYYRKGRVFPMKWMVPVRFSEALREKYGG